MKHKILMSLVIVVALLVTVLVIELLMIKFGGGPVPVPNTPRGAETYGKASSKPLTYLVLGDSTAVGQGGDYDQGIARSTARYLGRENFVKFYNVGVSGARAADVATKQLPQAVELKPDVVLIAVCANDVTHRTSTAHIRASLRATIDGLRGANPSVVIVLTGSPQMGSIPRFPQPIRALAKLRVSQVNTMVAQLAAEKHVTMAPLAAETGPIFAKHPELFAADNFHPTTDGYNVWTPVLERALATALHR